MRNSEMTKFRSFPVVNLTRQSNLNSIGERIKNLREKANLTVPALAKLANITKQTLVSWENNSSQPKSSKLQDLATALGVTPVDIIGQKQDRRNKLSEIEKNECAWLAFFYDASGLNQVEVAAHLGINTTTVSEYLNAKRAISLEIAIAFSSLFGVPINRFSPRIQSIINDASSNIDSRNAEDAAIKARFNMLAKRFVKEAAPDKIENISFLIQNLLTQDQGKP